MMLTRNYLTPHKYPKIFSTFRTHTFRPLFLTNGWRHFSTQTSKSAINPSKYYRFWANDLAPYPNGFPPEEKEGGEFEGTLEANGLTKFWYVCCVSYGAPMFPIVLRLLQKTDGYDFRNDSGQILTICGDCTRITNGLTEFKGHTVVACFLRLRRYKPWRVWGKINIL